MRGVYMCMPCVMCVSACACRCGGTRACRVWYVSVSACVCICVCAGVGSFLVEGPCVQWMNTQRAGTCWVQIPALPPELPLVSSLTGERISSQSSRWGAGLGTVSPTGPVMGLPLSRHHLWAQKLHPPAMSLAPRPPDSEAPRPLAPRLRASQNPQPPILPSP